MSVYCCPDPAHKDSPVPLAENSEGSYVCMAGHTFSLARIPGQGRVLCDENNGIFYDLEPFDLSLLQYRGEEQFESRDLRVQMPNGEAAPESPELAGSDIPDAGEEPAPPSKPKKVRHVSVHSVLALVDGLDFNSLNLNPQEWKVFAKIDGSANVADIVAASKLDEKTAFSLLAGLIKRGLVEVKS